MASKRISAEAELKALKADNLSLVNDLEKQNILYQQIRAELKAHELSFSGAFSELAQAKVKVEAELATWQKKAIAAEYEAVRYHGIWDLLKASMGDIDTECPISWLDEKMTELEGQPAKIARINFASRI
jgi:hypothetical protein